MDFKNGYKYFLDFLIGLAFISLSIVHQSAHAKDLLELSELSKPSSSEVNRCNFGMDGIFMSAGTRGDFSKIFRKSEPGSNFYVGYNWDTIMLEIGYLSTTRKSKASTLAAGSQFLGQQTMAGGPTIFTGQVRFRNTHFDLNFFTNFYDQVNIVTAIGVSFVRPNVSLVATNLQGAYLGNQWGVTGKTNAVPRAGIGLSSSLSSNIFVRSMGYFDQYSKIRFRVPGEPNNKPFKDAYTVSIGLLFKI